MQPFVVPERVDAGGPHAGVASAEDVGRIRVSEVEPASGGLAGLLAGDLEDAGVGLLEADLTAVDQGVEGGEVQVGQVLPGVLLDEAVELIARGGGWYTKQFEGGAGGGAIRLTVAGTLLVNGRVTANGRDGAGGGSGGSVFLTVGRLAGNGAITANGGATGDTYAGGGGGGRIAIYSDTNVFIGTMTASGGAGCSLVGSGTIYLATNVAPIVIAQYPSGPVNRFVSYLDLTFNQPVDPATFTTNDLVLTAPSGPIPLSQITLTGGGGVTWRIGFPT